VKVICLDGIAGIGKSTLLRKLEQSASGVGISTCRRHFFSDIKKFYAPRGDDAIELERDLLNADASPQRRADLFRQLCVLACDGFLSAIDSWASNLLLFDRSPLSYLAYSEALFGVTVKPWRELKQTIAVLRPLVVIGDVLEARERIRLRDGQKTKSVFHRLTVNEEQRVQDRFIAIAHDLGLTCCDYETAWKPLTSILRSTADA